MKTEHHTNVLLQFAPSQGNFGLIGNHDSQSLSRPATGTRLYSSKSRQTGKELLGAEHN